jgi:hypothetical protein
VILIDQSASMGLRSGGVPLIDRALDRARELIRGAGENSRWEVAYFDHAVHPFRGGDAAESSRLDELRRPDDLYASTDYGAGMAWARDVCLRASGRRDIYVLTDLQRSGLDWTTTPPFPADVDVYIEDLGKPLVNNLAVTGATASTTIARPDETISVDATIFNFGPFPVDDLAVTLTFSSGNRTHRAEERVALDPGGAIDLTFETPPLAEGLWSGTVEIDVEDELAFDNRRYVAVQVSPPLDVLLVDGGQSAARALDETFYLAAALRLAPPGEAFPASPFAPRVVRYAEEQLPDLSPVDLVVLAGVGDVAASDAARLAEFVRPGGGLLVFTGEQVTSDSCRALADAGLIPGRIVDVARAAEFPYRWQSWDEDHPLLEPFRDPQHGDLRRLAFDSFTRLEPGDHARVLARFDDGSPALLQHELGRGRVLWFTSSANRNWSDWPRSRLFLPLAHQMLLDLAGLTGEGPVRIATLDARLTSSGVSVDERAGGASPGVRQQERGALVVNVSPRESETARCTPDEFASRFEVTLANAGPPDSSVPAVRTASVGPGLDLRDNEMWHWAALAVLALLCCEAFLANRTTA